MFGTMNGTKKPTLTETKMMQAVRTGHHATVYEVRRDPNINNKDVIRDRNKPVFPFVSGSQYKGQWNNDVKEGFGIQVNPDNTKYEGEWMNNNYHGRGTLWVKKGKTYNRQYVGDWVDGRMEGQGIYYYENGEIYRGGWQNGKKSGNGRHEFSNGDVYVGDWSNGVQNGFGTLNYSNGNIFEGLWSDGKKEGPGIFFYASTKKIYQGEWSADQPRCGEFRAPTTSEEVRFVHSLPKGVHLNEFKLPELGLSNPNSVLDLAVSSTRLSNIQKSMSNTNLYIPSLSHEILEQAKLKFNEILFADKLNHQFQGANSAGNDTVHLDALNEILVFLGIQVSDFELDGIKEQLVEKEIHNLSFADIVEIIAFIQSEERVFADFGETKDYK